MLKSQLIGIELDIDLSSVDLATLKAEEDMIDKAQSKRLLSSSNKGSSSKSLIAIA